MIQGAIGKLGEVEQKLAIAALVTLTNLGVFESQIKLNTEGLVDGPYGEKLDVLVSRIRTARAQRDALDALNTLGKLYNSED